MTCTSGRSWVSPLLTILLAIAAPSCDRDTLSDGPSISGTRPSNPGEEPEPSDCPPPPAVNRLKVRINEVMVENTKTFADEKGKFSPWIELHNPTKDPVNMGDIPLTDDLSLPKKWTIPCVPEAVLPPGGFLVIFLDADTAGATDFHANFTLVPGPIQITLNKGSDIFEFDATDLAADKSTGRHPDGTGDIALLKEPTPAAANAEPDVPVPGPDGKFIRGDADGSGKVTITDMAVISRVAGGTQPVPPCADALDVNDDGAIGAADASYLGSWISGSGPPPRPPFPAADVDPTPDDLPCAEAAPTP